MKGAVFGCCITLSSTVSSALAGVLPASLLMPESSGRALASWKLATATMSPP